MSGTVTTRSMALPALLVLAAACTTAPPQPAGAPPVVSPTADAAPEAHDPEVAEPLPELSLPALWQTETRSEEGFAGLAVWPGVGQRPWLLAAAAASHRLVLFDAGSGELLRELGTLGERPGRFREPVDVAVAGDLAFVVERGNARVQVLRLPGLATVAFLGEGELERPVAVAVEAVEAGWAVWVAEEAIAPREPGGEGGGGAGAANPLVPDQPLEAAPVSGAGGVVHRFTVAADGSPLAHRWFPLGLDGPGRVAALAFEPAGRRALMAVSSPAEAVGFGSSSSPFDGRSLHVVSGAVAGSAALFCREGSGWLVASPAGGLLAFSPDGPVARAELVLEVDSPPVALVIADRPSSAAAVDTLYVATADSRIVAVAGGEVGVSLGRLACR